MRISETGASGMVRANGLTFHYLTYGEGEPSIFVLPGITSPAATWEFIAEDLAGEHKVVVMDIRGRGLSDKPPSGYRLLDYVADAAGVIKAVGLDRPIILSHAMGARAAILYGALYPERTRALILVDPPLSGPGRPPFQTPLELYIDQLHMSQRGATADDMRNLYPKWPERELEVRARWLPTCDEGAILESYENFNLEDVFGYWRRLEIPCLFLYGAQTPLFGSADLEELKAANAGAEFERIDDAGHMVPWDNKKGCLDAIRRFTAELINGQGG